MINWMSFIRFSQLSVLLKRVELVERKVVKAGVGMELEVVYVSSLHTTTSWLWRLTSHDTISPPSSLSLSCRDSWIGNCDRMRCDLGAGLVNDGQTPQFVTDGDVGGLSDVWWVISLASRNSLRPVSLRTRRRYGQGAGAWPDGSCQCPLSPSSSSRGSPCCPVTATPLAGLRWDHPTLNLTDQADQSRAFQRSDWYWLGPAVLIRRGSKVEWCCPHLPAH